MNGTTRLLMVGVLMVSLAAFGVGTAAATPGTTSEAATGTVADADGTNCAGSVCDAVCTVAGAAKQDCAQSTDADAVDADGTDCVDCQVDCTKQQVERVTRGEDPYLTCPA